MDWAIDWNLVAAFMAALGALAGPLTAWILQRGIDKRTAHGRKLAIFKTLKSHRGNRMTESFAVALNEIEIEFYCRKRSTRKVLTAWKQYCERHFHPDAERLAGDPEWQTKTTELFNALLAAMGEHLGYRFEDAE